MIEPLHLYSDEKERMKDIEKQGFTVMTCNNWLCPFNNDGYCVSPQKGDECIWDKDFATYLDAIYDDSLPDEVRKAYRTIAIWVWGRKDNDR